MLVMKATKFTKEESKPEQTLKCNFFYRLISKYSHISCQFVNSGNFKLGCTYEVLKLRNHGQLEQDFDTAYLMLHNILWSMLGNTW